MEYSSRCGRGRGRTVLCCVCFSGFFACLEQLSKGAVLADDPTPVRGAGDERPVRGGPLRVREVRPELRGGVRGRRARVQEEGAELQMKPLPRAQPLPRRVPRPRRPSAARPQRLNEVERAPVQPQGRGPVLAELRQRSRFERAADGRRGGRRAGAELGGGSRPFLAVEGGGEVLAESAEAAELGVPLEGIRGQLNGGADVKIRAPAEGGEEVRGGGVRGGSASLVGLVVRCRSGGRGGLGECVWGWVRSLGGSAPNTATTGIAPVEAASVRSVSAWRSADSMSVDRPSALTTALRGRSRTSTACADDTTHCLTRIKRATEHARGPFTRAGPLLRALARFCLLAPVSACGAGAPPGGAPATALGTSRASGSG